VVSASIPSVSLAMSSERVRMTSTAPVAVTPNRPGQDARLAFEGVAGQQVKLIVSDSAFDTGNFGLRA
jgi:hypothetical protein